MKLSVIIAAYNVEKYIERCLKSCIEQTYKDLEIIVVNDGSEDETLSVVKSIAETDSRVIVIDKPNGGLSSARNAGIDVSTGNYIGFVDGDDYIALDMYEFLYEMIRRHDADIAVCGVLQIYRNTKIKKDFSDEEHVFNNEEGLKTLLQSNMFYNYATDKLYRKELFDGIRYPEGKIFEDVYTTYKLLAKAKRTVYCNNPKYYYVQRAQSILRTNFTEKKLQYIEAASEIQDFILKKIPKLGIYTYAYFANANCALLIELIKYNYKNSRDDFADIGHMLNSNIRKNIFCVLKSANSNKKYKLLSLCSLLGYRMTSLLIGNFMIMKFFERDKELF